MADTKNSLTAKQRRAADALAAGARQEDAAIAAQVHVATVYRWLSDNDAFAAHVKHLQAAASDEHIRALTAELKYNRDVMRAARDDDAAPWHVRLKAVAMLEDSLLRWRDAVDVEQRLSEIEAMLHAKT